MNKQSLSSNSLNVIDSFTSTRQRETEPKTSIFDLRRKTSRNRKRDRKSQHRKKHFKIQQFLTSKIFEDVEKKSTSKNNFISQSINGEQSKKSKSITILSSISSIISKSSIVFSKMIIERENQSEDNEKQNVKKNEKIKKTSKKHEEKNIFSKIPFSKISNADSFNVSSSQKISSKKAQVKKTRKKINKKIYKNAFIVVNSKKEKLHSSNDYITVPPTSDHHALNAWLQKKVRIRNEKIVAPNIQINEIDDSILSEQKKENTKNSKHFRSQSIKNFKRKKQSKGKNKIRKTSKFQKSFINDAITTSDEFQQSSKKKRVSLKDFFKKKTFFETKNANRNNIVINKRKIYRFRIRKQNADDKTNDYAFSFLRSFLCRPGCRFHKYEYEIISVNFQKNANRND